MKILFLTHYFPPEVNAPANRTFEHCREWAKDPDVEIKVVTNFPNHPDGRVFPGYKNKFYQKEKLEGIEIIRLLTFVTANEGFLLRTMNYIFYLLIVLAYAQFSKIKFDVVIATSPQFFCGLAGKYLAKIKKKPFILEIRDLWPESIVAVGAIKNKHLIARLEGIEKRLYHSADHIISVTKSFVEHFTSYSVAREKISIFFNGVNKEEFEKNDTIISTALRDVLNDGSFKVGYVGTIGMAHSLITLVKAAEQLVEHDIKFIVIGSGADKNNLQREIESRNLQNFYLYPIQPKSEISSIISLLDVFVVHLKRNELFKTVIPSKLFEGMIMKKPILIGVDGEARNIVEESNCGIFFEPENQDHLVEKILYLKDRPEVCLSLGLKGYEAARDKYSRVKIAGEYLAKIKAVCA